MKRSETRLIGLLFIILLATAPLPANQTSELTMDIYRAAQLGDMEQLNLNLAAGADPSKPNDQRRTPLDWAIDSNRQEAVKRLLEAGADVNASSYFGPPLVMAAVRRRLTIVELLVAADANVNIADTRGQTALLAASYNLDKEMIEILVDKGADVNAADRAGQTPLVLVRRDPELVSYLREHGAQEPADAYDRYGPYGAESMPGSAAEPGRSVRYQSNAGAPSVLDDPNAIREKLAAFPSLAKVIKAVDANAASEERSWASRRMDNRTMLIRTVAKQFGEELRFLKGVATEEKAQKTAVAIDALLARRTKRYDLIGSDLREQRRLAQQDARQMMGRGRGRSSGRPSRGRGGRGMSTDAYGDSTMTGDSYATGPSRGASRGRMSRSLAPGATDPRTMSGPYGPPAAGRAENVQEEPLDPETENQLRAWLGADPLDKRSLLEAVHNVDLAELDSLRQTAIEEGTPDSEPAQADPPAQVGAKKTTAAIEGLMLARQGRLDRIMAKMAADDARLQRTADRYGTTNLQTPTRSRRGRGRMPQQPDQPTPRRGRR